MGDSQGGESRFSPLSAVARTWFAQAFLTGNTTGLPGFVYENMLLEANFSLTMARSMRIMPPRNEFRGIAQSGSAPALGAGCRGFKSLYPDQIYLYYDVCV